MPFLDLSAVWCIEARAARNYLKVYAGILARRAAGDPLDRVAVEAALGRELGQASGYEVRQGVAVLPIRGAIVKHGSMLDDVSGTPSVEGLRRSFDEAVADNKISAVVLDINSPGGQVSGIADFATHIRSSTAIKPVVAFADGALCSAAYWLASAASEIVLSETAHPVGSIGAMIAWDDDTKLKESLGIEEVEFISSQSPLKNPDPATKEGKAEYQQIVDTVAEVFISEVAQFRGVSVEEVQTKFGKGGCFVGAIAVDRGLADRISTLDEVVASLAAKRSKPANSGGKTVSALEDWLIAKGWKQPAESGDAAGPEADAAADLIPVLAAGPDPEKEQLRQQLAEATAALESRTAKEREDAAAALTERAAAFCTLAAPRIAPAALKCDENTEGLDLEALFTTAESKGFGAELQNFVSCLSAHPLMEPVSSPAAPVAPPKTGAEKASTEATDSYLKTTYPKPALTPTTEA